MRSGTWKTFLLSGLWWEFRSSPYHHWVPYCEWWRVKRPLEALALIVTPFVNHDQVIKMGKSPSGRAKRKLNVRIIFLTLHPPPPRKTKYTTWKLYQALMYHKTHQKHAGIFGKLLHVFEFCHYTHLSASLFLMKYFSRYQNFFTPGDKRIIAKFGDYVVRRWWFYIEYRCINGGPHMVRITRQ